MRKRETLGTRFTRLEGLHADLAKLHADIATRHAELDEKVKILLDAQIKTDERFRQTDERIEKLVSAIGELIRRVPLPQ